MKTLDLPCLTVDQVSTIWKTMSLNNVGLPPTLRRVASLLGGVPRFVEQFIFASAVLGRRKKSNVEEKQFPEQGLSDLSAYFEEHPEDTNTAVELINEIIRLIKAKYPHYVRTYQQELFQTEVFPLLLGHVVFGEKLTLDAFVGPTILGANEDGWTVQRLEEEGVIWYHVQEPPV